MFLKNTNILYNAIFIYLLLTLIIIYTKPAIFYDSEQVLKRYGLNIHGNKTLFPFPVMLMIMAIFIYLFCVLMS